MTPIGKQLSFCVAALALVAFGQPTHAQDKAFTLKAPEALVESGLLKFSTCITFVVKALQLQILVFKSTLELGVVQNGELSCL